MNSNANIPCSNRFNHEGDDIALAFFADIYRRQSPEEYAAREAQNWGCFSLHFFRYRDPALGAWIRRLGELLDNPDEIERLRQQLLTREEIAEVRRQAALEF